MSRFCGSVCIIIRGGQDYCWSALHV